MLIRYFGAAQAAAGVAEERLDVEALPLTELLEDVQARFAHSQPSMAQVISRSSFLLNEVALRDRTVVLDQDDVLDILPPFAGG
ncbi:MoaD/ThiS family protein [Arthrobacter sp. H5]|uniref:MoaD/ThiS family protein n=1 Tax=Arthrobacter sp. H5 TaxID=1267973 RepID=UPI000482F8A0|nr:MoaD/ThiS family protein [Arthrobacter sp. H5]